MREKMKVGDLVAYREEEFLKPHGVGLVARTSTMYAYVWWTLKPAAQPFIAHKKHLELVSESR